MGRMARLCGRRGRGSAPGLVALLGPIALLAGCADELPVAEAVAEYRVPRIATGAEDERVVHNRTPRERLIVHRDLTGRGDLTLLFLDGRAATPLPGGGAAWADTDGARALLFDRRGRVDRVLQTGPDGDASLAAPVTVVPLRDGFRVEERDGSAVLFPDDGPPRGAGTSPAPVVGGGFGVRLAARSVLYSPLAPVRDGDPLLWRIDADGDQRPLGRARPAERPLLGELENSGWATPAGDGGTFFAFALRPELIHFDGDGRPAWRATWEPERKLQPAAFRVADGALRTDFSVVQHALVRGPDDRVYLLAAPRQEGWPDRLLVFDDGGILIRDATVPPGAAIFADRQGRIFVLPHEQALSRTPEADRAPFAGFELPLLAGGRDAVRLEDYGGRVVVLNFWASWCPPCRREIPLLDRLARELDPEDAAVIGLNDDVRSADGRGFLEELGGVSYPNAAGHGELRRRYGYRGLPYTVVLDREHRVARSFYGFGSSIEPIAEAVRAELARAPVR